MARREYKGAATPTTITSGITSTATSLTLTDATNWPTGSHSFVIDPGLAGEEKILATSRTGTVVTITTRGYDNTTASSHIAGAITYPVPTAIDFDEANSLVSGITAGTGITMAGSTSGSTLFKSSAVAGSTTLTLPAATDTLVGKATTDTLTNKTLTSPVLTTPSISTITTKGDLLGYDTALNRIPIGTNNQVLTADSAQALGLKWATPTASGKSYALLSTSTLTSGTSTAVTGLSGYDKFIVLFRAIRVTDTGNNSTHIKINSVTTGCSFNGTAVTPSSTFTTLFPQNDSAAATFRLMSNGTVGGQDMSGYLIIEGANTSGVKMITMSTTVAPNGSNNMSGRLGGGVSTDTAVVSTLTISTTGTAFLSGTMYIYGAA